MPFSRCWPFVCLALEHGRRAGARDRPVPGSGGGGRWCAKLRGCWWPRGSDCGCALFCCCPSADSVRLCRSREPGEIATRARRSLPSRWPVRWPIWPRRWCWPRRSLAPAADIQLFGHPLHLRRPICCAAWCGCRPAWALLHLLPAYPLDLRPADSRQLRPQARIRSRRARSCRAGPGDWR